MVTKKQTPTEIVETAFAALNARIVQLHQQGDDLFDAGRSSYSHIKLIERYIVSIPHNTANHLYAVSKKLFDKIDWDSLATFLFPGKEEDYYIDDTQKYYKYLDIIEVEEPTLKKFFKDLPALIQLNADTGSEQGNSSTEKIKLNYSVDDIGALLAILFDSKIIVPTNKAEIYRLVANNFSSKKQENISADSLRKKTDTPDIKSLGKWETYFKKHSAIPENISASIDALKAK